MLYTEIYASPIGDLTLISDGNALTGINFPGGKSPENASEHDMEPEAIPVLAETKQWLNIYFGGKDPGFTPTLKFHGTEFQREVWRLLLKIPFGRTVSYKDLAIAIEEDRGIEKMSAQAVGGAVSKNLIPIIVPCHRVIGSDGSLTGFAGGLETKKALLRLEGISIEK